MPAWYEKDRDRFREEVQLMHEHTRARLHSTPEGLVWRETIRGESRRGYELAITYPARFPHERPRAYILRPSIDGAPHRLLDGSLCLFESPFACDVRTTAAVVRNRAVAWILCYELWSMTGVWFAREH